MLTVFESHFKKSPFQFLRQKFNYTSNENVALL